MAAKHALIGGGTGFIGKRLSQHLKQNGYDVTIISRMPGVRNITWHELEKSGIPNSVNAVVNLAGQNVLDPSRRWTDGFKQNVWNSRVKTTELIAKSIEAASSGVKAFVSISGVHHYPENKAKIYNEQDEVKGFDYMSKLSIDWEKAANLSEEASRNCRTIKLRCGVVVGRDGGMIESMWIPFQLGLGGPFGDGKQILPWIHIDDLCRLIHFSMENDKCSGIINAVAPQIVTNKEFCKIFASVLKRPCIFSVPEFVVKTLFGEDRSALLLTGQKIEPKRARELGFEFKYPTARTACEEVVKNK